MGVATAIGIAGLVVGVAGAVKGSKDAKKAAAQAGDASQEVAEAQAAEFQRAAEYERKIAGFNAMQIRRKALEERGTQLATAAHNGVVVGDGTVASMVAKTMRLAKQDMLITLYEADATAKNLKLKAQDAIRTGQVQTDAYKAQGKAAQTQALGQIASTALNAVSVLGKQP